MPVSHIPSADAKKASKSSYKRRKDQNSEISELEALLPWSQKGAGIDKISVLRLTATFLKFREFWATFAEDSQVRSKPFPGIERLFSEAIDGFMIILSSNGEVLYVSESVADYVGVTQQEIIGLSIYELTHSDDHDAIRENLKAKGIKPRQFRQFYVRFKSSISPVKKQLSKFGGTIMLQVSGNLKISQRRNQFVVTGLIAECRRIESSSSILEISIPQSWLTSTSTMDLKILSVDTKVSTVTLFDETIKQKILTDFFLPFDGRKGIQCLKTLLITGQSNSQIVKFMTHSGEWVWVQIQGLIRYEKDNRTPKFLEANFKLICASKERLTLIEQKELYGRTDQKAVKGGIHADPRFSIPDNPTIQGPESVIKPLEEAKLSQSMRDAILHSREEALMALPKDGGRLAVWEDVVEAVVQYEVSQGLPANYENPYPAPPPKSDDSSLYSSPVSSLSPESTHSLSLSPSGSSIPLSHPSPQSTSSFSSVSEPTRGLPSSQNVSTNISASLSATFEVHAPSDAAMQTLRTVADRFNVKSPDVNTPPTTLAPVDPQVNPVSTYSQMSEVSAVVSGPSVMPSNSSSMAVVENTTVAQPTGMSSLVSQHNGPNAVTSQYNGPIAMGTQYFKPTTMESQLNAPSVVTSPYVGSDTIGTQYLDHSTMSTQHSGSNVVTSQYNGPTTMGAQYFEPTTTMVSRYSDGETQYIESTMMAAQPNVSNGGATQYNGPGSMGTQYNGSNTIPTPYNGPSSMATQYNGPGSMGMQYNGSNTISTQYNGPSSMATQYNGPGSMGTQYNGSNTIATQYNGPSSMATQYNGPGSVNTQHNGYGVIATQHNGPNAVAAQYNGPNVMATQFNGTASMASQYTDPFSQSVQFGNPATGQYSVVANQYVGVQPPQTQWQQQQPQQNIGMSANNPYNSTNPNVQQPPTHVINMNVTINVPAGVPQDSPFVGTSQLTHQPDQGLNGYPTGYSTNCMFQKDSFHQVGKIESPMGGTTKPCNPYNLNGTFEISHTGASEAPFNVKGNIDADDILEALQLM